MEPCDMDFYLEKNVFPKNFKYKILRKRKIDSQNFECDIRIALNDYDDVKEWFKKFNGNTNTEWLLRQSTICEEYILNQLYVCQNSSFGKKRKYDDDECSKSDFNCKAAISVKIKKGGKRTYYQDDFVKKGYKGIMRICFIHTHLIDKAKVLNMARQLEETKKTFIGYFTEGMTPSEAIKNHEEILLLEGHEDLGISRENPTEHWVYSLYEEWTKQIENRLQLESQLTRASVFWRLQNRSTQSPNNSKSKNIVKLCKLAEDINGIQIPADLHVSDNDEDDDSDSENQYDSYDEDSTPQVSTSYVSVNTTSHQATASSPPLKLNVPNNISIARGRTLNVMKNNGGGGNKPSTNARPLFDEDDDSDSENQYDSYDEDSSPQVSTSYVSVNTTSHQATSSYTPLKLNVPNNYNIARGRTLNAMKNNGGGSNKPSTNARPLFMAIEKSTNTSQGNSVQIITTSQENKKKSVFKFLTVSANSRNCTDIGIGKTFRVANSPKVNHEKGTDAHAVNNSKELRNVPGNSPRCIVVTRINRAHFTKKSCENSIRSSPNVKPVFVKIKKDAVTKEAPSVKCHEVQKDTETVLQNILTKFQNSNDKDDIGHNGENKQADIRNKAVIQRSDLSDESMKPILKKCNQNSVHSPLSESLFDTGNVLKSGQNHVTKRDRNCLNQVSKSTFSNITQQAPLPNVVTYTKDKVSSCFNNPSSDEKRDNDLKNIDQHKGQKTNHFTGSEMLFQNCEQQFECLEKLNKPDSIIPRSMNDSFVDCQTGNLVLKNYCDIANSCSSSSPESLSQVFSQSSCVQSITNPISSAVQSVSRPMLFDSLDTIHKLPINDTETSFSSALCHENPFNVVNQGNTFQNFEYLERLPIQGCPFPLPEDLYSTLTVKNDSSYMESQSVGVSQMLSLSKDLHSSIESSKAPILDNQNATDISRCSSMLVETFCNTSDSSSATKDSGNYSICSDLSYSLHDPDFSDSCNDLNSLQLTAELDKSNEDSLKQIFPDLSKLENELSNHNFDFLSIPNHLQMVSSGSHASVGNQLSSINTCTNYLPELQVNPLALFESYEDNFVPLPENLKGNIEDIDLLKNILNIKCNKLESSKLEELLQQPKNCSQREILEKWDFEMCRLRSLLERNCHDRKLMSEANNFLERIKESVVTPSELAILFSSACNLNGQQK